MVCEDKHSDRRVDLMVSIDYEQLEYLSNGSDVTGKRVCIWWENKLWMNKIKIIIINN